MEGTQIKEYSATESALGELRQRLAGVKYEVMTSAGMDLAKKDRRELVTLRTSLEAKRKEIKAPALERCQLIDAEAKRITTELLALEKPIDEQIKAEEARKEEERAEKARVAAAAQKVLDDKILEIGKLPIRCIGKSADEIALFLATLEAKEIGGEFTGETRARAEAAKAGAVEEIRTVHAAMVEAEAKAAALKAEQEAEAARMEEERIERERLAAIEREANEKRQAELDEQKRLQDIEAARLKEIADAEAEKLRIEREAFEKEQREAREKEEAIEAEKRREAEAEAARIREEERQAAILAEQERIKAEKERKAAEKARKLAEAKCKDADTAFKKILAICQSDEHTDTGKVTQIALIAEAML